MANLYDKAYELAAEIEKDENYLIVKQISQKVMDDPEKSQQLDEFRFQQYQIQRTQMQGEAIKPEDMAEANRLYEELTKNAELKKLLDAEQHLSTIFADINRILTGPLEKVYKKD